jgi:hypothetical protein
MKKLILLLITLTTLTNVSYASFPIAKSVISVNYDPTTDSWIPIIIAFWSLLIIILVILIRIIKRLFNKNK